MRAFVNRFASSKSRVSWGALSLFLLLASVGGAWATDPPSPPDYATAAGSVKDGITPIITTTLPVAVGLMVLFMGPRILKRLIKSFSS